MARPRKEVTEDNVDLILEYLNRATTNPTCGEMINGGSLQAALVELNSGDQNKIDSTQKWLNTWLTDDARKRMWAALRQKRYKQNHSVRMVALSNEAFRLLSDHAILHKMTLSQAVEQLLKDSKTNS